MQQHFFLLVRLVGNVRASAYGVADFGRSSENIWHGFIVLSGVGFRGSRGFPLRKSLSRRSLDGVFALSIGALNRRGLFPIVLQNLSKINHQLLLLPPFPNSFRVKLCVPITLSFRSVRVCILPLMHDHFLFSAAFRSPLRCLHRNFNGFHIFFSSSC